MVGPDRSVPAVPTPLPLMVIDEAHVFAGDELHAPHTPALALGRASSPSCRHREFSLPADQATSTHKAAAAVAVLRVLRGRGRQRITRHVSSVWKRGVWFIQDTDAAPPARRIRMGFDGSSDGCVVVDTTFVGCVP